MSSSAFFHCPHSQNCLSSIFCFITLYSTYKNLAIYIFLFLECLFQLIEIHSSVSSVTQSCLTLWGPMDCSTPGFRVHHQHPELAQTHVHRVGDATISSSVVPFSCLQSSPASGSFPVSQLLASAGQSIGASASASVHPMNIQDCFPLWVTGLISLESKGLFSNNIVQKHQLFDSQLSLGSNSHIYTWLLEKL